MADWSKILQRGNVEDRRAMGPMAFGGLSVTGLALLFLFNVLTGGTPEDFLSQLENVSVQPQSNISQQQFEGNDSYEQFASTVLGSNNAMWSQLLTEANKSYQEPRLVLFRSATDSSCGTATSTVGPHYCPHDQTIYLDETFFDEMKSRFGAKGGDVAEAYVIAHEVAHHVQNQLGIMDEVYAERSNDSSIKLELQADCFAGLWANSIKEQNVFEPGEIEEAMDAAAAVGDDRIQEAVTGSVNPERWTHGSSEQRKEWFNRGYTSGQLAECNTFS